jgi:hypothetical protein
MPKRRQNGTTTVPELAILASNVGLVEDTEQGRQAFTAWYATDQKAARAALFARAAARRVAASVIRSVTAAERQAAASGHPTNHGMRVPRSAGPSVVRSSQQPAPVARVSGPRVTEAGD